MAVTRPVSRSINDCELSFQARQPIDVAKASAQHRAYQDCLSALSVQVVSLAAEPDLPDAVFVEDPAVILDEAAIISIMGAPSRRPEAPSIAVELSRYRPVKQLVEPATLEGGDVIRVGRSVFVGLSQRTNREGFRQLRDILSPYDYQVEAADLRGCLHLKSACSYIGNNSMLINRSLIDPKQFRAFQLIDVADGEPAGANALLVQDVVIMPASFPKTRALLEQRGFCVRTIDLSELQKAEGGVTCTSSIFNYEGIAKNLHEGTDMSFSVAGRSKNRIGCPLSSRRKPQPGQFLSCRSRHGQSRCNCQGRDFRQSLIPNHSWAGCRWR